MSRLAEAAADPSGAMLRLAGRAWPPLLLGRHARLAAHQGLRRPRFILSLDCDTERDLEVVEEVHQRLGKLGIRPVYAVPGELLERGREIYGGLAGAEFMNHGHRPHTRWDPDSTAYQSTFSYDGLPFTEIATDVRRGHAMHLAVFGRAPRGFRAPHFAGLRPRELAFLHDLLAEMGYHYSTSTAPRAGLLGGPLQQVRTGLWEIPVTGCYDHPLGVLDSYNFRYAPGRRFNEEDYVAQFRSLLAFYTGAQRPCLLNLYADPSQVHDWAGFFECVALAAPWAVPGYEALLAEVGA